MKTTPPTDANAVRWPKAQFCEVFGVSEAQLERHFQAGCPHEKQGRRVFVPMPGGRIWYHNFLIEKGKKQGTPSGIESARQREAEARTELVEIELAEKRRDLMHVDDYDRMVGDAFARVDARLQSLAPRLAGVVLGAQSIQEAQARIDPLVQEARDELRAADDIPRADDDEVAA